MPHLLRPCLWLLLAAIASPAGAQVAIKLCPAADLLSIEVSSEPDTGNSPNPGLEIVTPPASPSAPASKSSVAIVILGPILGSMDALEIGHTASCTPNGIAIDATSIRSADFHGGVHKNILRRPKITLHLAPHRTEVRLRATWTMRLSTGFTVSHAATPPYREQTYPQTREHSIHIP